MPRARKQQTAATPAAAIIQVPASKPRRAPMRKPRLRMTPEIAERYAIGDPNAPKVDLMALLRRAQQ